MNIERILKAGIRGGASDIILKVGERPRFRFEGDLVDLSDGETITSAVMRQWMTILLPKRLISRLEEWGDADFAYQSQSGYRFRVNLFRQKNEYGLVLRVVSNHIRTIEELQLPPILTKLAAERRGLILVTGAAGSGKSTTLAAMVQKINRSRQAHIVTIEDPIEFNFKDLKSTIQQREVGSDAHSFGSALKASLRQSPDVILVGELRDHETVACALMAAETGHLVLSTLHTADVVESLGRLLSFFPGDTHGFMRQGLGSSLKAIICQRLVKRLEGKGQIAAHEILINNANVRDLIQQGKPAKGLYEIMQKGQEHYGMCRFDDSLYELFRSGMISREEALSQATERHDLMIRIGGITAA